MYTYIHTYIYIYIYIYIYMCVCVCVSVCVCIIIYTFINKYNNFVHIIECNNVPQFNCMCQNVVILIITSI